ncbi:septum formation family protein [Blastococcus sp. SYSU D00820]
MRRARRRSALLGCAAALLLAGCTSTVAGEAFPAELEAGKPTVPPAGIEGADPAALPVVGACYEIGEGQEDTPLEPPMPVECGGEHNAETAVVEDTGLGPEEPRPNEDDVTDPDTDIGAALSDLCDLNTVIEYLGGESFEDPYAFYATYLPSEEAWSAGARWMRCDVYYGYVTPRTSPGVLANALAGDDAAAFRTCFVGTPSDFAVTPCDQNHDAEPVGYSLADIPSDAPYPDDPTRQAAVASCSDDVQEYLSGAALPGDYVVDVWVDTAEEWENGAEPRCVVRPAAGGQVTGSLRP